MDKILETSLGNWSTLYFEENGRMVANEDVGDMVVAKCDNYQIFSKDGVLVHMTRAEYESLLEQTKG
jgi:hypothetical protein